MLNWTDPDLRILAGLYVQNEQSFVVRRCVQRFLAGEMTAREAVLRIRQHPDLHDDDYGFRRIRRLGRSASPLRCSWPPERPVSSEPASHTFGQVRRTRTDAFPAGLDPCTDRRWHGVGRGPAPAGTDTRSVNARVPVPRRSESR